MRLLMPRELNSARLRYSKVDSLGTCLHFTATNQGMREAIASGQNQAISNRRHTNCLQYESYDFHFFSPLSGGPCRHWRHHACTFVAMQNSNLHRVISNANGSHLWGKSRASLLVLMVRRTLRAWSHPVERLRSDVTPDQ